MDSIIDHYLNNLINYEELIKKTDILIKDIKKKKDVTIIIPIMGRSEQIISVVNSLKESIEKYNLKNYRILFIEHDSSPLNKKIILDTLSDYVFIPKNINDEFNKSLCMNIGSLLVKSKYFLFHDVDIIVKNNFFKNIFLNLKNNKVLHCMSNRRVVYTGEDKSEEIKNKTVNIDNFSDGPYSIFENLDGYRLGTSGATGGSIFIKSDLFYKIGGYDDSFFSGYSLEDYFFWLKVELFEKIVSCDDPKIIIFHLHHSNSERLIPNDQEKILSLFLNSTVSNQLDYVKLKSKNFKIK